MKRKTSYCILFAFLFLGLVFAFTAGSALNANAEEKAEKKVAARKHADAQKCGYMCCMVCKKMLDKKEAKFKAEYKGKTFYFESEKCKVAFGKDPEKYSKCCEAKTYYVCPMKQCNYKADKAGKCAKCGMALKKVVAHAACCVKEKKEAPHKHDDHKGDHKH